MILTTCCNNINKYDEDIKMHQDFSQQEKNAPRLVVMVGGDHSDHCWAVTGMVILKKGSQFTYLNFNSGDFTEASRSVDYAISEKPSFGKRLPEIP
ncbi:hypothetical protein CFP56_024316 [Quercus suber]|uniref:Uncharacterized protein n=1 Tax=Quercus suber TaxID=58331 RepID=A0AAW0MC22_QUESU